MGINSNHTVEEIEGVRCSIVEKNASKARVDFLSALLLGNGYTVVTNPTPAPKAKAAAPVAEGETPAPVVAEEKAPETFTIGVTDAMFNPTNAVFGRLLRTKDGHVVTLAYWHQKDPISQDEVPYYVENL